MIGTPAVAKNPGDVARRCATGACESRDGGRPSTSNDPVLDPVKNGGKVVTAAASTPGTERRRCTISA